MTDRPPLAYEVIGVNVTKRQVFVPSEIIHGVCSPAATAALDRLVVCGGAQLNEISRHCQLYSPKNDRYARTSIC